MKSGLFLDKRHRPRQRPGVVKNTGKILPALLVAALVLGVALVARKQNRLPQSPQAAINQLFDAAGRGDDEGYLQLVTGPLRQTLREARRQMGPDAFRQSLRQSIAGVKGLAVRAADGAPAGYQAMEVELIFADRIERQRMLLVPQSGGWAIAEIEKAQMIRPPIPYGTPVFEEPLEAAEETP